MKSKMTKRISEKIHCNLAVISSAILILYGLNSCKTAKEIQITSGGENLRALTKVTDVTGVSGEQANGGYDESDVLFLTLFTQSAKTQNIYKKELANSQAVTQLTFGNDDQDPCYCASIGQLAFSQYRGTQRDIYLLPSKGSYLIPITETPNYNEYAPSFSKDGVYLAYQRCKSNGNINDVSSEIWLKNLTTGENMLLGNGFSPKISPDGKKIAFAKCETNSVRHIWVMDLYGSNAKQLTNNEKEFAGFPSWSPDGEFIVFQNLIKSKKSDFDLYIVSKDGTNLMQITTNKSADLSPFWSTDNSIYFTSDRGSTENKYQIWKFKPFE